MSLEYKVVEIEHTENYESTLNEYAALDWELIAIVPAEKHYSHAFVFKRTVYPVEASP